MKERHRKTEREIRGQGEKQTHMHTHRDVHLELETIQIGAEGKRGIHTHQDTRQRQKPQR